MKEIEKEVSTYKCKGCEEITYKCKGCGEISYKCKGCEEIVDDSDFNCELELCYYCLDMMKEEEKEGQNESGG